MGQTVYVDLLFMINFSMDFLCFFLCARILGRRLSLPRALIASAVGGIYSDLALFIGVGRAAALAIDLAICVLICAIAFWKKGKTSSLPLYILVYFAISMALGGFMTAIFNLLNKSDIPLSEGEADGISVWMFALLAALSGIITLIGGRAFRRRSAQRTAELEISYNGKTAKLCGLVDTGNLLREPISGKPCIIADISSLSSIIPPSLARAARKGDISAIGRLGERDSKNVRIVPIKTAGGDGALIALRAEEITLNFGKGAERIDALVALSDINRSAEGSDSLLPPELLN